MKEYLYVLIIIFLILYIFFRKGQKKFKTNDKIAVSLIINSSLNMSNGKIFAQLGHALFDIVSLFHRKKDLYEDWKQSKTDVTLYKTGIDEIKSLSTVLHRHNIRYNKIIDAGKTQIPSGSNTILIVGPDNFTTLNNLLSHLPLFL